MIKMEVGPQPEIGESQAERIYILPKVGKDKSDDFGIFILADGNNRSKVVNNTDYDDGGKNVIRIAEALAERGDVSIMVGSILSPENIAKRSDRFFYEMYIAFIGLGTRIEAEGTLIKSNIRLEVHGDIAALRAKGGYALKLADMMETVCAKTAHLDRPRLRLILGVNYDEDSALDLGCDMIFRSGMESEHSLRLSGTRAHEAVYAYGSTKLWPEVTPEDINRVVDDVKRRTTDVFQLGYSIEFMINFLRAQVKEPIEEPFHATLAVCGSEHEIRSALVDFFSRNPNAENFLYVTIEPKKGYTLTVFGNQSSNKTVNIILGSRAHMQSDRPSSYSSFLAPGQSEGPFKLPTIPEVGYANIQRCEATPEGITEGIRRAIMFNRSHVALKGGERIMDEVGYSEDVLSAADLQEFTHYDFLRLEIADMAHLSTQEIVDELSEKFPHSLVERYELAADIFTVKIMDWASDMPVPRERATQYRAFMNYILTSFFLLYKRPFESRDNDELRLEERAALSAKYMISIYSGDEAIFDYRFERETPEQKRDRVSRVAQFLQDSVDEEFDPSPAAELPHTELLIAIAKVWQDIISEYGPSCHPAILTGWKSAIKEHYQGNVNERDPDITSNILITKLQEENDKERILPEITDRYASSPSDSLNDKVRELLKTLADDGAQNKLAAECELRVLSYLLDVKGSIAIGLIYRSIALSLPEDEVDQELLSALDRVSILSDCYYRLLNDMSGMFKSYDSDQDHKADSCSIAIDTYSATMSRTEATIKGSVVLFHVRQWLKTELGKSVRELSKINPFLGNIVERSRIGHVIYSNTHYKDLSRDIMGHFMSEFESELAKKEKMTNN